ncbi:GntR family transcriptional regulator, partial [Rhizobium ruizarguesonis]
MTAPVFPVVACSTVQRVYDDLRKRIITIQLPPDTTLSRTELTETYEVSQTPIRERAEWVKRGILQSGGFPMELPALYLSENYVKPTTMLYRN